MKILISVLLALLLAVGWIAALPKSDVAVDVSRELEIAQEQMDLGAYGSAINYYRRAADKDGSLEVQLKLWDAYMTAGKQREAKELLVSLLEREKPNMAEHPDLVFLYGRLADMYAQAAEWQEYLDLAREACTEDREFFDAELAERYFSVKYQPTFASKPLIRADSFIGDAAVIQNETGAYYVNGAVQGVAGPYHKAMPPLGNVRAVLDVEDHWRFVDSSGQLYMASNVEYDWLWSASGPYALGCRDGQYYYLNDHCQEVMGPYDEACPFAEGVAAVREGNTWHLIDVNGAQIGNEDFLSILLDETGTCSMGKRVFARTEQGWQLFDLQGNRQGDLTVEDAHPFAGGGFAAVKLADGWAFVNSSGGICCGDLRFDDARSAGPNQLAAVKQEGLWGYILGGEWVGGKQIASWKMVIPPQFEEAKEFSANGLAPVKMNGSWYYIKFEYN